jgi:hypothetical protein
VLGPVLTMSPASHASGSFPNQTAT